MNELTNYILSILENEISDYFARNLTLNIKSIAPYILDTPQYSKYGIKKIVFNIEDDSLSPDLFGDIAYRTDGIYYLKILLVVDTLFFQKNKFLYLNQFKNTLSIPQFDCVSFNLYVESLNSEHNYLNLDLNCLSPFDMIFMCDLSNIRVNSDLLYSLIYSIDVFDKLYDPGLPIHERDIRNLNFFPEYTDCEFNIKNVILSEINLKIFISLLSGNEVSCDGIEINDGDIGKDYLLYWMKCITNKTYNLKIRKVFLKNKFLLNALGDNLIDFDEFMFMLRKLVEKYKCDLYITSGCSDSIFNKINALPIKYKKIGEDSGCI